MAEIVWDEMDERFFERGVDHGVLYTPVSGVYSTGVPWNGLTNVTQAPSGAESSKQYADNIEYVDLTTREEFGATIEAMTYPEEFLFHEGVRKTASGLQITMQTRPVFGFCWRTLKGNAEDEDAGFIVNMAYGCKAAPSEKAHMTINDSVELTTFSWTLTTTPVITTGYKPTSFVKVDSTDPDVDPVGLNLLLDNLYGRGAVVTPRLPLPDEVDSLLTVV